MGASAILLTAKILPKKTFQHLIELALGHGLTPFVEIVDQAELDSVIHPEECIIAVNNKDINTREREPGDIDTSRSLLEATIETGTPCPVSASAITRPADRRRAGRLRLQGAPDRDRPACAPTASRAGSTSSSATAPSWRPPMIEPLVMSQTTTRSIADHFAEQVERQPRRAGADLGRRADLLRRPPAARGRLVRRARRTARLPEDRPVGIRAKKSPEAIALILACLRSGAPVPAPLDRARARDARAAVRPGRHEPGALAPRTAQRKRGEPARARRRRPRPGRTGGSGTNQSGRRRAAATT